MICNHHAIQCVLPPYVTENLAASKDPKIRKLAADMLSIDAEMRATRAALAMMPAMAAIPSPAGKKHRLVYDAKKRPPFMLPGRLVRSEGEGAVKDEAVNEAYDGAGDVYDFYNKLFNRNSLDGNGMSLISSVHVGNKYNNAFWNGEQMAYGDGDGKIFNRFTRSLDVIGHELSHGVITHTCNLEYKNQPGALNEHFADVFGTLVKQWKRGQSAGQADWMIGAEIMGPKVDAQCLRTMTGAKAYEKDPLLGTDPQPKHMNDFVDTTQDNGGVHINSGIPNHAFYLTATALGGNAWERVGRIWYRTMLRLTRFSDFQEAAAESVDVAGVLYGADSREQKAVRNAWEQVGISIVGGGPQAAAGKA